MKQVIGELQELGALDPAAQQSLMADLRQTDPALWPLVMQQFRAAAAFRRRAEERQAADAPADPFGPIRTVSSTMPLPGQVDRQGGQELPGGAYPPQRAFSPVVEGLEAIGRLPATGDAALAPPRPPQYMYPVTPHPEGIPALANRPPNGPQASQLADSVVSASHERAGPGDWHAPVTAAIRALELQLQGTPTTPAQLAGHAQLRMLYLLVGQQEDALQPIPSAPPAVQEFWAKELYGLATWLDTERTPDATRRAGETKRILEEATTRLGESAPLVVRNLAFCTEVQSYGCAKQFQTYRFAPGQEVLLYAEVENFASEATPKGFHTSLRSSYQIFDSRGQRVADHQVTTTQEYCQNHRRDFFIAYRLPLPKRIYPGKHTLQLTIEDLKSQKVGQSSIDFTIADIDQ